MWNSIALKCLKLYMILMLFFLYIIWLKIKIHNVWLFLLVLLRYQLQKYISFKVSWECLLFLSGCESLCYSDSNSRNLCWFWEVPSLNVRCCCSCQGPRRPTGSCCVNVISSDSSVNDQKQLTVKKSIIFFSFLHHSALSLRHMFPFKIFLYSAA